MGSGRSRQTQAPELDELEPPDLPDDADVGVLFEELADEDPDCGPPEAAAPEPDLPSVADPEVLPLAAAPALAACAALELPDSATAEPAPAPATASAPDVGTAASLVLLVPPLLLRKSVTYQPEPLS